MSCAHRRLAALAIALTFAAVSGCFETTPGAADDPAQGAAGTAGDSGFQAAGATPPRPHDTAPGHRPMPPTSMSKPAVGCPEDPPPPGTMCGHDRLCTWRRNGACPPDPDVLRQCREGRWLSVAPAIDCRPQPARDAGAPTQPPPMAEDDAGAS